VETQSPRLVSGFELLGAQAAEVTATANPIVKGIEVDGHISGCETAVPVDLLLVALFLQAAEQRLLDGVVPSTLTCASCSAPSDESGRKRRIGPQELSQ